MSNIIGELDMRIATLFRRSDGIIRYVIKKGIVFEPNDVEELVAASGKLGEEKKHGNLFIVSDDTDVSPEGRIAMASEQANRYTIADAFVINSLAHKIIANFYLKVNKPPHPTKFFSNEKDAIKWLKTEIPAPKK